ncbi:sigma 54-interacting transcriptional regulator [Metallumcola ferriviriculae]|uniref:HTH-type transcriptional regulatory protein TyrR n=1 Tax=Metallumcola ferriviriculae TaxID=3039180 RepID=A0AAU0UP85_9FIRM|nr:sigma 54-interacting transcriptional regulator [Desulfitibacteraceae bacterium MK1]
MAHSRDITEAVRTTSQLEKTEILLKRYAQEIRNMKLTSNQADEANPFIGKSREYSTLIDLIKRVSAVDTTVLITGETGVGKNNIAKYIHQLSERHNEAFVHVNCGALPEPLIESELFGYKKGAFTGANSTGKTGLVAMADKGTLLLDEIGELPLSLQVKLLQFLQDKTYLPVGDTKVCSADVRVIATTNRDLTDMIKAGAFRSDLFYRLDVLSIKVPPLCERKDDIFPLLYHYLKKFNSHYGQKRKFKPEVLDILYNYDWPGNIRELENLVERLVITSLNEEISAYDLPEKFQNREQEAVNIELKKGETLPEILEQLERKTIENAYLTYKTTRKTAKALGITQSSLMRRLKKYGLSK